MLWGSRRPYGRRIRIRKKGENMDALLQTCFASWVNAGRLRVFLREEKGQGTTEYAILVGVLVVIAIIAIVAFRGKVTELWNAIADGINSL